MKNFIVLFFLLLIQFNASSQFEILDEQFRHYKLIHISSNDIMESIQNQRSEIKNISLLDFEMQLFNSNIISPRYQGRQQSEKGVAIVKHKMAIPMRGTTSEGSSVSLTFNDNFVYGYIATPSGPMYIEPIYHYIKGQFTDTYVTYFAKDIKEGAPKTCGVTKEMERTAELHRHLEGSNRMPGGCFEVEYAIANDFLMFQNFNNSTIQVENHAIGVTNDVQTNYDDEFDDEIQFNIVEQFFSTCSTCDPWTSNTEAEILLQSFRAWGPSGFSTSHDVGSLWTDRNLNGSTIGIAFVGVVCTSLRYNVLQNFSTNANLKRVMVAHEIGHNFDATHDSGGGFIMSPSVNNTNTWSTNSINEIEAHYLSRNCLDACSGSVAPTANFTYSYNSSCIPASVSFTNTSVGGITNYQWSFPGGSPSSSTQQNPTVTYNNEGVYDVTLTVSNGSQSNTLTLQDEIVVNNAPVADFTPTISNGNIVSFVNNSQFATSYFWDFGDLNTSTLASPVHTYQDDGTYTITLFAYNDCGQDFTTTTVTIATPPISEFTGSPLSGCDSVSVNFESLASSNSLTFTWEFEGGNPTISSATNPTSKFNQPGFYDVTLTVENFVGTDILTKTDYVKVYNSPIPTFTETIQGLTVTFNNTSQFSNGYVWNFGDGNTSTDENPTHTYLEPGTYTVTLQANSSQCASKNTTKVIPITLAPIASFTNSTTPIGCAPYSLTFEDNSSNGSGTRTWFFEGGSPQTSTEATPTIIYNTPGQYDVTLIVSNSIGADTLFIEDYVQINTVPIASFIVNGAANTISFINSSSNATSYLWDFGDGSTSTDENPSHTYATEGTFSVVLMATNDCGTVSSSLQVTSVIAPVANFTASSQEVCAGETIVFTDQSQNSVNQRMWTFIGGSPATANIANPSIIYNTIGTYDVSLAVSNAAGTDSLTQSNYITVIDIPTTSTTSTVIDNIVTYTYTGTGTDIAWTLPDGSIAAGPVVNFTAPSNGSYIASVTASNACGTIDAEVTAVVDAYPTANITSTSNTYCIGDTVFLQAQLTAPNSIYQWNISSIFNSTSQNAFFVATTPGTIEVELTVSNGLGSDSDSRTITIISPPTSEFVAVYDGVQLTTTNLSQFGATYLWNFGDGKTSTAANPIHQYKEDGTYTISLIVTNECGTSNYTQTVEVVVLVPGIDYNLSIADGCAPLEVNITDQSSNNPTSWSWVFEGGNPSTSNEQNPTVTYTEAGTYDIIVTVTNAAGTAIDTFTQAILVNDVPTVGFTFMANGGVVDFTSNIQGATIITWDFGNGTTSNLANPQVTYDDTGVYTVTLSATNDCGTVSTSSDISIVVTNTNEIALLNLSIFPNPNRGSFNVNGELTTSQDVKLSLINAVGTVVWQKTISNTAKIEEQIDLPQVPTGMYAFMIETNSGLIIHRIIVE